MDFETSASSGNIERTKEPCAGDTAKIVVTLTQRESIDDTSKIEVILHGRSLQEVYKLDTKDTDKWFVEIRVPKVPFKVYQKTHFPILLKLETFFAVDLVKV